MDLFKCCSHGFKSTQRNIRLCLPIREKDFTSKAWDLILWSGVVARSYKHATVETEHFMMALQKCRHAHKIFAEALLSLPRLLEITEEYIRKQPEIPGAPYPEEGRSMKELIQRAREYMQQYSDSFISVDNLVRALTHDKHFGEPFFRRLRIERSTIESAMASLHLRGVIAPLERSEMEKSMSDLKHKFLEASLDGKVVTSDKEVTVGDIVKDFGECAKMDVHQLDREKLLHLEEELLKHVVGQESGMRDVVGEIQCNKCGLCDPGSPTSILLMGPIGVGKTKLAKAIASYLFNTSEAYVKIDMRLPMAMSTLVMFVKARPHSVIMFDNIENSHRDNFSMYQEILKYGRLTESNGSYACFSNTIIIMRLNVPQSFFRTEYNGDGMKNAIYMNERAIDDAKSIIRPALIELMGTCVLFQPLGRDHFSSIVRLELKKMVSEHTNRKIQIFASIAAIEFLATIAFELSSYQSGALPVKRVIRDNVLVLLSEGILSNEIKNGEAVFVDLEITACTHDQQLVQKIVLKTME